MTSHNSQGWNGGAQAEDSEPGWGAPAEGLELVVPRQTDEVLEGGGSPEKAPNQTETRSGRAF